MATEPEPLARVRAALAGREAATEIRLFPEHLPTVQAAAEALGVEPARIAKSVVLVAKGLGPVLALAAGDQRVDRKKVKALLGGVKVSIASADEVLAFTGFVAGGVSPVGWLQPATVLLDQSLQRFPEIWAGGGIPEALLRLPVADLPALTGGRFAEITEEVAE